jgi:hypothetical protein
MADFQTLRKTLMEEADKPNATTYANRATVEALRFHKSDHYYFNEGYFELVTTADTYRYKLPQDFVRALGDIYYTPANSPTAIRRMTPQTMDFVTEYRYVGTDPFHVGDWESGLTSGPPSGYAFYGGELIVHPVPDTSSEKISGRYVRDLWTPEIVYDGTDWQLYEPWSRTTTLPATFTNAWFQDGFELIRARAMMILQQRYYKNGEAAQAALIDNLEAKNRLLQESTRRRGKRTMRGSF